MSTIEYLLMGIVGLTVLVLALLFHARELKLRANAAEQREVELKRREHEEMLERMQRRARLSALHSTERGETKPSFRSVPLDAKGRRYPSRGSGSAQVSKSEHTGYVTGSGSVAIDTSSTDMLLMNTSISSSEPPVSHHDHCASSVSHSSGYSYADSSSSYSDSGSCSSSGGGGD